MSKATTNRTNRYASQCDTCHRHVPAGAGSLTKEADGWIVRCADSDTCQATQTGAATREVTEAERQAMIMAEGARRQAETGVEPSFFDVAADIDAQLRAEGRLPGQSSQQPVSSPRRAASTTSRRRRACVSGGNCASTTGRDCGGWGCDAN